MSSSRQFSVPIPKGYRIFFGTMDVAGVSYRKADASKAFLGKSVSLGIEPEPSNKHDRNALKVVAFKKGWFLTQKLHIGYIPKDVAAVINEKNLLSVLLPRPKDIWVGDRGGFKISIDLLGPKNEYSKLNA